MRRFCWRQQQLQKIENWLVQQSTKYVCTEVVIAFTNLCFLLFAFWLLLVVLLLSSSSSSSSSLFLLLLLPVELSFVALHFFITVCVHSIVRLFGCTFAYLYIIIHSWICNLLFSFIYSHSITFICLFTFLFRPSFGTTFMTHPVLSVINWWREPVKMWKIGS